MTFRCFVAAAALAGLIAGGSGVPRSDAQPTDETGATLRVLSWNVSGDSFVKHPEAFRQHLIAADPDLLLLDEASGTHGPDDLRPLLNGLRGPADTNWNITWGAKGGRQRGVIASRFPVVALDAFQSNKYPEQDARAILALVPSDSAGQVRQSLDDGIPVHGAVVTAAGRRLLTVTVDLQCCSQSWQELRRLVEAKAIRRMVADAIARERVDAAIVAGDFNVAIPLSGEILGAVPLLVTSGPYPPPVHALVVAEAYRRDGTRPWTIDGRETGFPSAPFDFQFYSPATLSVVRALVLDSEDGWDPPPGGKRVNTGWSRLLGAHRPIVVSYAWKPNS